MAPGQHPEGLPAGPCVPTASLSPLAGTKEGQQTEVSGAHREGRGQPRGLPDLMVRQAESSSLSSAALVLELHLWVHEEEEKGSKVME